MPLTVYRASELGACSRRLIALRQGYDPSEPPEKFKGYFARGDHAEEVVKAHLRERGFEIDSEQSLVRISVSESVVVEGHIDGRIVDEHTALRGQRVLEVKRMNHQSYTEFVARGWDADINGLMAQYKWQVSAYMVATGLELQFTAIDGDTVDSDTPQYHSLYLEKPFYTELQIRTRVLMLEAADAVPDTCDRRSYPCPVWYVTGCQRETETVDADEEMIALVKATLSADAAYQKAKSTREELRGKVKEAMGDKKKVTTDVATVSMITPKRSELDREKLTEQLGDLNAYTKTTEGEPYPRITKRGGRAYPRAEADGDADAGTGTTDGNTVP
jgi:hypothetical protein